MDYIAATVSANSDFYEKWAGILSNESIFKTIGRTFLWGLAKLLAWLCNACENLLYLANKTLGFIYSDAVTQFISEWRLVIIGVLIIAILIFGITMITQHKQDRSKMLSNIAIAVCVLIGIATVIPQLSTRTADWSQSLLDSYSSSSETIIQGATTDLYYMDANDFSDEAAEKKNNLSADQIMNINPVEVISPSDDVINKDVFSYRLNYDKNGTPIIDDIDDSGFSWNNDCYYRYSIDYMTIYVTLIATAIVMIFTAFKVVKISFDIIVHQILATIMAAGDWANGQKLKEVIKSLFALFFSVFMCSVMMKLYFMFSAWTSTNIGNGIGRAFLLIFAAFAVIDGPNIVEKLFGVDAGLSSVFRSVSTLFFATRGAAAVAHGAHNLVNGAARAATHGIGGIYGFAHEYNNPDNADIANDVANNNEENVPGIRNNNPGKPNAPDNANANNTNASQPRDNHNAAGGEQGGGNPGQISEEAAARHDAGNIDTAQPNNNGNENTIANQAQNRPNNDFADSYLARKYREPRSIIGAERRGNELGSAIGNAAARRRNRRHAEHDNMRGEQNNGND